MPLRRFLALTTAGSLLWNSLFVVAGYVLGENWQRMEGFAAVFEYGILGLAAAAVVWFTVKRVRARA